ncbi:hypothetical protein NDA11_004670 [Ustilago hordei]|uniref:EthD domain-containing protein n=1 Tax=Ustilago hordei TaxID=120017 RepID=I2FZ22_USTHO|nr:uncharacterized protein UHO2_06756 [Ustilago hordei]KAJ1036910.1 hypothetical protein NDA10_000088 [Ustilago hordei]KAJ1577019.1 hypothetical protein NDA15_005258 [Ustilago hordei]KAJ1578748.1 hypothetical protein NDA12_006226 [Ustilago hordei]KAJ1584120.1 hypothetical protein NDA11_004670 [Ustilago hordei]KAJ1599251.1 hypothetical protein NDA14_005185 [Ustilago hordei]
MSSAVGRLQEGIKICIYLVKKKDMSDGEFVRYYSETHARLALPALVRHACISYTQFHCCQSATKEAVTTIFGREAVEPGNALHVMPYDACSSFVFPSIQQAQAFFHDEETAKILGPDAGSFTDPSGLQIAVGREFIAIAESNVVKA